MLYLKQSAVVSVKIGPFLDETDGKTAEDGLTLLRADIRLSKNGGDLAQKTQADAATIDELGYYDCPLDATDTGTLGTLLLAVHEAGALPVWHEFMVVTANVWDTLCGASTLNAAVTVIGANVLDAAAVKADAVTKIQSGLALAGGAMTLAGNAVDAAAVKADAVTKIQAGLSTLAAGAQMDLVNAPNATALAAIKAAIAGASVIIAAGGIPVGGFVDNSITKEAIATDAFGELELAAGAVDEIADEVSTIRLIWIRSQRP